MLASFVELINEECSQSMRIKLTDEKGQKFVSIYPKISGSISDKEVQANPEKYSHATVATEAMLTPDMLSVTLAATVGVNASKQFAENANIQKVSASVAGVADEDEETTNSTNGTNSGNGGTQNGGQNGGSGTGTVTPSGGDGNGGNSGGGNTGGGGGNSETGGQD